LSKVADGKRTTGYADEDFIAGLYGNSKDYTEENEAVCKKLTSESKLDTTNIVMTT
jgi:hypothetical protein